MEQENIDDLWKIDHLGDDKALCEMVMASIREYVESVEQLLIERKNKYEQNMPSPPPGMDEDDRIDFWGDYYSGLYEIESTLPKIQRYALFVYSFSFFESMFKKIAESYKFTHDLKSYASSYKKDKGIARTKKYLKNIGLIEWPESWSTWKDIEDLNRIRNLIMHNDGHLHREENKNPREEFLKRWSVDMSEESFEIELSERFIFRVLDTFKKFLNELYAKFETSPGTEGVI